MSKVVLITGATDGIGLATAKMLATDGHTLLLHGRTQAKLDAAVAELKQIDGVGELETYSADLSDLNQVVALAEQVRAKHQHLDVLINNAGVYSSSSVRTADGQDLRFVVNTLAPYLLTEKLLPILTGQSRVVNLSSAAQAPVELAALRGEKPLADGAAYAQSKLALTMFSVQQGLNRTEAQPLVVAVNPASYLGSKMVRDAYGMAGHDLNIGADILVRAALSDEFANASGQYYDNDAKRFAPPHSDALQEQTRQQVIAQITQLLAPWL